jgi:DNA polymerase-3 subunit delta'
MPFSEVVGHARPLGLLSRSLAHGSLPPSLLFSGPEGVGKRLVAKGVSQALNCLDLRLGPAGHDAALALDACGSCLACRKIERGVHPDLLVIERPETGSVKIDEVREAIASTGYRPFEGRRRVVVLDEADRLNPESQNALLKSLEEPPASSVFILISSRPETLLATVRSRCSRLRFGRLAAADVARLLTERHRMDAAEAYAAAAVADGSPGRALSAGSRAFRSAREAALSVLRTASGRTSPADRLQAAAALISGKAVAGEREELATRVRMLASLVRDVALVVQGGGGEALANADLAGDLAGFAAAFDNDRAVRAFGCADQALAALRRNASPKVVAAWLAVQV